MEVLYYWNDKIPEGLNPGQEPDPEEFFYKMVYIEEDKWSYITPDLDALMADLNGTPFSSGISPAFIRIGEEQIILIVEFVYPGSPADRAGIQRGDLFLTINGTFMNIDNYSELFNQSILNMGKGMLSGNSFIPTGETITINAEIIEADPLVYSDIISINGIKTGYFVYSSFTSGTNNKYLSSLDNLFLEFKNENISELIIDLRYNLGGEIDVAGYLASAVSPFSVMNNGEILVNYLYNKELTEYFKLPNTDPRYLGITFPENAYNLDLSGIHFLTGWKTASASELLIIGLKPYMNVKQIGESTYGKYTASWVISDTNDPPEHSWAMMPIVLKYANKDGYTDFRNGLTPDYTVTDPVLDLKPFGDPGDPVLAKARELIGGVSVKSAVTVKHDISYTIMVDESWRRKSLLVVEGGGGY